MWTIYQDAPEFGCDDNPSYKWFAYKSEGGHIVAQAGPFETLEEAEAATE